MAELFEAAGLHDIDGTTLTASLEHASFEEWWEPFTGGVGPAGLFAASLDAELWSSCASAAAICCRSHRWC